MHILAAGLAAWTLLSRSVSAEPPVSGQSAWDKGVADLGTVLSSPAPSPVKIPIARRIDVEDDKGTLVQKITFGWSAQPSDREASPLGIFHLYTSPETESDPLIVMFPITGDPGYMFSKHFCNYFFSHGYRCVYLERYLPDESGLPDEPEALIKLPGLPPYTVTKAMHGLDLLEQMGIIRPGEKIGVGGVSLGAIDAADLALTDARVGAAALLLGGGDIPKILRLVHGAGVGSFARTREKIKAKRHWTDADFEAYLRPLSRLGDPLVLASDPSLRTNNMGGDHYLMINAEGDTAIPNECSRELYEALSKIDGTQPSYNLKHWWAPHLISFAPKLERHVATAIDELVLRRHWHARKMRLHFDRFLKTNRR